MVHCVDYAEAPKEGYWPFLGAVASGLEVVCLNFLGLIKKLSNLMVIFFNFNTYGVDRK